jgi:hypothetical protein
MNESRGEKIAGIMSTLYQARRAAKGITEPTFYKERIQEYQGFIRSAMTRRDMEQKAADCGRSNTIGRCTELQGAMACIETLQKAPMPTGVAQMWILAACVEMLEPS